ncbi:MAG: chorismate mutase [Pseudonocardia sp.]|nr:chorismate mutase [Pseudonocardia sp.]
MSDPVELGRIRDEIDKIDREVVRLLAQRGQWVTRAAGLKRDEVAVRGPARRVEQVVTKARAHAEEFGLEPEVAERTYRALVAAFIDAEQRAHGVLRNGV